MVSFFLILGVIGIGISGFFLGAWTDLHRPRDNSWTEVDPERAGRTKIGLITGAIGLASLAIGILLYYVF